jgi:tetratricopeptide (TPR) repeat protein
MFRTLRRSSLLCGLLFFTAQFASSTPQASSAETVVGSVRESNGAPVSGARVVLDVNGVSREAMTDGAGNFSLTAGQSGSFVLRVHKAGFRDFEQPLTLPLASKSLRLSLVRASGSSAAAASEPGMQFNDKADFTIAGITDWTAAGGHGSDVNLRASESLAKDTRTLSPARARTSVQDPELEKRLREAVLKAPSSFHANRELGAFCLRERRYDAAIPPLEKAHALNSSDFDTALELAQAYEGAGQHSKANTLVEPLLVSNPRAEVHRLAGDIRESLGDPLAAEREYELAVKLDPSEQNYFAWGAELLVHRAVEAAVRVFTSGVGAFPQSERMLAALGAALYANGAYEQAASNVCKASDLSPSDPEPYLFLGRMAEAAPQALPCVEETLGRFVQEHPGDERAKFYYAVSILKTNGPEERRKQAEALLAAAVRIDPKFAEAYLQLGVLQSQRGDWENAKASYERAVAANSSFPDPHFRLAQVYKQSGDSKRAAEELQVFERLKQSDAAAVEQRRREIRQFVVVLREPASRVSH